MLNTTKTLLVVASLLTVSATAMAATSHHKAHRGDARNEATSGQFYAGSQGSFNYDAPSYGTSLFDRAKGYID